MFGRLRLRTKLVGAFVLVAIITLVVGMIGFFGISKVRESMLQIGENQMQALEALQSMHEAQATIVIAERTLVVPGVSATIVARELAIVDEHLKQADDARKQYLTTPQDEQEKTMWRDFTPLWSKWIEAHNEIMNLSADYQKTKDPAKYQLLYKAIFVDKVSQLNNAETALIKLIEFNGNGAHEQVKMGKDVSNSTLLFDIISMGIGTAFALLLGVSLSTIIIRPILASVNNLRDSTYQVSAASVQLTSTAQQLAEGNAELASSIEETSSTLEEFTSMINQNNENTHNVAKLSMQAKTIADKGYVEMNAMQQSIVDIKKSSDKMAKIIKVIDGLSFQTNILSINAAVEAARAGEAGQSFAVVADEVRNLAQSSAQAAKDIAEIIETNIELSKNGAEETQKIAQSLTEITEQSKKVNELIDEIAAASKEQTQGILSINRAMQQMEKVTQSNASNAEESAASSEEMSSQANVLNDMAKELVQLVYGKKDQEVAPISKSLPKIKMDMPKPSIDVTRKPIVVNPEDIIPLEEDNGGFQ